MFITSCIDHLLCLICWFWSLLYRLWLVRSLPIIGSLSYLYWTVSLLLSLWSYWNLLYIIWFLLDLLLADLSLFLWVSALFSSCMVSSSTFRQQAHTKSVISIITNRAINRFFKCLKIQYIILKNIPVFYYGSYYTLLLEFNWSIFFYITSTSFSSSWP